MMKLPSTEPPACTERQKQRNKNRRHFRRLIGQAEMQFDCPSWPFFFIALVLIARENGQRYHRPQSDVYRHHVSLLCVFARLLLYRGKKKATPKRDNFYYNMALMSIRPICAHFVIYFFSLLFLFTLSIIPWALWPKFSFSILCSLPLLNRITSQYLSFLFYFLKRKGKQKKIVTSHRVPKCNLDRTHGCLVVGTGQLVYIQCRSIEFKTAGHRDSPTLVPCSTTGLELSKLLALTHVQMEIRLGVNVKGLSLCRSRLGSQCFLSCQAKSSIIRNYR
jgi:hypothetical protein